MVSKRNMVRVKVKVTLVQALRLCTGPMTHRGSRGIALSFHGHGTRRGDGSESRPGRYLPPGKTRYPLYRRLSGPQGRSGQVRKISPPPEGFDPQAIQPVASRYTDYVTPPTKEIWLWSNYVMKMTWGLNKRNLSRCHFVHRKPPHGRDCDRTGTSRWEAGD